MFSYNGGNGHYGGGGGGGGKGGNGGHGGFGGGGGAGYAGVVFSADGGNGGFGGGGGVGPNGSIGEGRSGSGGMFGGNANHVNGGGGAALGGAIFNDSGNVFVKNSTFTGNYVTRGNGGGAPDAGQANNGRGAGGAIFSRNGTLTVRFATISGNEATGSGGGIVVARDGAAAVFNLQNTIVAGNGPRECFVVGEDVTTDYVGNVIADNAAPEPFRDVPAFGCGGVVSQEDPALGVLRNNQGPTPTMAIGFSSSAKDAASTTDSEGNDITLPGDQRGERRPRGDYDVGAYELCLEGGEFGFECLILGGIGTVDVVRLEMRVSPTGTGTTTPPAGPPAFTEEVLNSIVAITATPNTGTSL